MKPEQGHFTVSKTNNPPCQITKHQKLVQREEHASVQAEKCISLAMGMDKSGSYINR